MIPIAKQLSCPRYIFKIHSKRLRAVQWNLTLDVQAARSNGELVSISNSQMLRWIDELNGNLSSDITARNLKRAIKHLRSLGDTPANRHEIDRLYRDLDRAQFRPDYMTLVVDTIKDYRRAVRGFTINGIKFVRLLGTSGGVKKSTIVFVNEKLADELRKRIDNGRIDKPMVPAKFEAYRALTCSGSTPVSFPHGIIVLPSHITHFKDDVIHLRDGENGEPVMEFEAGADIELEAADGYGLMLPSLAERWSQELQLHYVAGGMNTRFAWEKGMVFAFDFLEFAEKVAGTYKVIDAWGTERDVRDAELILTTSQVKLWDCYESMEHYLKCCEENHYTFGIPKVSPECLDTKRSLNYQFIQSYRLSDEQIAELVQPTIDEIQDIMRGDWRKAILYLAGTKLDPDAISYLDDMVVKALMADPKMMDDPYVQTRIHRMIRKRINDAKIGVVLVDGNYSILSGDPYALCQSMFGLEVTGLLKAGQLYNKHWSDRSVERVACFRAPMSCHNNIRVLEVAHTDAMCHWYQYMGTISILNDWDTTCQALNGADKDGDLLFTTSNQILIDNVRYAPTLMCEQRKAAKQKITEDLLIESNIAGFGDDIGKTTNWITSMYDVQCQYPEGSREYETLEYRIQSGQHYQQNCIDKIKGIVSEPMPQYWYSKRACYDRFADNPEELEFQLRICADRKPYFMQYIYPKLAVDYKKFVQSMKESASVRFQKSYEDLISMEYSELPQDQQDFVKAFSKYSPVSMNQCVANRIAYYVEDAFDHFKKLTVRASDCDASMMSGVPLTATMVRNVNAIFKEYLERCKLYKSEQYASVVGGSRIQQQADVRAALEMELEAFRRKCQSACSNSQALCDILLSLCYRSSAKQQFVWEMCGDTIVQNLLSHNHDIVSFPMKSSVGNISFGDQTFILVSISSKKEVDIA